MTVESQLKHQETKKLNTESGIEAKNGFEVKGESDSTSSLDQCFCAYSDELCETSSEDHTAMSPLDLGDEKISFVPSDDQLKEPELQPSVGELMPEAVSATVVDLLSSQPEVLITQPKLLL